MASSAALEKTQFALAQGVDAALLLARHLPLADAEKCIALAKEMLAKRWKVEVTVDPFDDKAEKSYEDQYLPEQVWEGLFKRWMQVAPQDAWAFVEKHHSNELPLRIAALRQWALHDPFAAVKATGQGIKEEEQMVIANACTETNPSIGLQLLVEWGVSFESNAANDSNAREFAEIRVGLLQKFAARAPREALDFCQSHFPNMVGDVCAGWMRSNANECLAWISEHSQDEQKNIYQTLCEQPDVSIDTLKRYVALRGSEDRCELYEAGLSTIAHRDPALAQSLIGELFSNPTERLVLREQIAVATLGREPRKAMEFILPSLRDPLPINHGPQLMIQMAPGHFFDQGPSYGDTADFFEEFLSLGENGGANKETVLAMLQEIHPQHRAWMMESNINGLSEIFGRNPEWLLGITYGISRDDLDSYVACMNYPSSTEIVVDMKNLPAGDLRDAMAEHAISTMLEEDQPVAVVVEKAKEWGGNVNWHGIYQVWFDEAPEEALHHFMSQPQTRESEWHEVISSAYSTHSDLLVQAVERMPLGEVRDYAMECISFAAMKENADVVTSIYFATGVQNRVDRNRLMQSLWTEWQNHDKVSQDPRVIDGVRQNIEHSQLDAAEKRRWLDRLESEVSR